MLCGVLDGGDRVIAFDSCMGDSRDVIGRQGRTACQELCFDRFGESQAVISGGVQVVLKTARYADGQSTDVKRHRLTVVDEYGLLVEGRTLIGGKGCLTLRAGPSPPYRWFAVRT